MHKPSKEEARLRSFHNLYPYAHIEFFKNVVGRWTLEIEYPRISGDSRAMLDTAYGDSPQECINKMWKNKLK